MVLLVDHIHKVIIFLSHGTSGNGDNAGGETAQQLKELNDSNGRLDEQYKAVEFNLSTWS